MKKITRNILVIAGIVMISSCTITKEKKDCCKKTAQEVYEYEGLTMDKLSSNSKISTIASDMIDWICEDVENDRMPEWTAEIYIEDLKEIIKETE
jgi:PBP1b-binding outer membrane lipoprotein LpoB